VPTPALIDWSETTGILLSEDIDFKLFEGFLLQLSTDENLKYREVLSWLLSLRIVCNQKDIVNAYFECFEKLKITEEHTATDKWIWANITLHLECNDNFPIAFPDNNRPSKADKYLVQVFNNQNLIDIDINDSSSIHRNTLEKQKQFSEALAEVFEMNLRLGAAKSSSILIRLARRYISFYREQPASLIDWGAALQRLGKHEDAFDLYAKATKLFIKIKNPTPFETFQHGILFLSIASQQIETQDFEDLDFYISNCDRIWKNLTPEIENCIFEWRGRLLSYYALFYTVSGQIDKANEYYKQAINIFENAMPEWLDDVIADYCICIRQATLCHIAGDKWDLNVKQIEEVLTLLNKPNLKFRLDLQLERARLVASLANNYLKENSISAAQNLLSEAEYIYKTIPLNDHGDADYELGMLTCNFGRTYFREKKYKLAIQKYSAGLKLMEDNFDVDNPTLVTNYGLILANKATAQNMLQENSNALITSKKALQYYDAGLKIKYPLAIIGNARLHITLANIYLCMENYKNALKHLYISENIFNSLELRNNRDLDTDRFKLYLTGMKLIGAGIPRDWILKASRAMCIMMEMKIDFTVDGDVLHTLFIIFHYLWINHSTKHNANDIPIALGAIHSRVLSRRVLDQIRLTSTINLASEISQIIESRAILRGDQNDVSEAFRDSKQLFKDCLKTNIQESIEDNHKNLPDIISKNNKAAPLLDRFNEKQDELLTLKQKQLQNIKFYRKVREELSNKMPWESSLSPYSVYDVERLRKYISKNQAILFLIDLQLPQVDDIPPIDAQIAWLCPFEANSLSIELSLDLDSIVTCTHQSDKSISRYLTRNGPSNSFSASNSKFENWQAAEKHINVNLWGALTKHLPKSVEHILLVTHGRFHLLPSDLGHKSKYKVSHFLSMLFLGKEKNNSSRHTDKCFQVIPSYHDDLPLSNYESHPLLTSIWDTSGKNNKIQISKELDDLNADQVVDCLHVSGHGKRIADSHRRCHINHLCINEKVSIRDETVFSTLPSAKIVWLSACVLGIAEHDKEGDPTGLVMPFLLKGSRYVIACLTPIPDLWMPLLVSLTEWLVTTKDISIDEALILAKDALLHKKIDSSEFAVFKKIYVNWLRETCIKWFLGSWSSNRDMISPWTHCSKKDFDDFTKKYLENILPNLGCTVTKQIISDIIWINDHQKRVDAMIDIIIDLGLNPPLEVCERLKYSVKLFSSNASNSVSF